MGRPKDSKNGLYNGVHYRRLRQTHRDMMQRCYNLQKLRYENYGGRGITVFEGWHEYSNFEIWASSNGYTEDMTIERKDVNGPYSPTNCIWIPLREQALNTRRSKILTAFGESKSMAAWAKDSRCVVSYYSLRSRVRYGWTPEAAISVEATPGSKSGQYHG